MGRTLFRTSARSLGMFSHLPANASLAMHCAALSSSLKAFLCPQVPCSRFTKREQKWVLVSTRMDVSICSASSTESLSIQYLPSRKTPSSLSVHCPTRLLCCLLNTPVWCTDTWWRCSSPECHELADSRASKTSLERLVWQKNYFIQLAARLCLSEPPSLVCSLWCRRLDLL